MIFPPNPIPVNTPLGEGYVLYIKSNGILENDEFTVVLDRDGAIKHFLTSDIHIFKNQTYKINEGESWDKVTRLRKHFNEWSNTSE